ncbi:hypothetical protein IWZ01DRAFT_557520 [Phyllosticta capitalensis]
MLKQDEPSMESFSTGAIVVSNPTMEDPQIISKAATTTTYVTKEDPQTVFDQVFCLGERLSDMQSLQLESLHEAGDDLQGVLVQATMILQAEDVKKLITEKSGKLATLSKFIHLAERTVAHLAKGLEEIVVEETTTTTTITGQATTDTNLADWDTAADIVASRATVKHAGAGHKPAEGSTFNIAGISDATSGTTDAEPLTTLDDDD